LRVFSNFALSRASASGESGSPDPAPPAEAAAPAADFVRFGFSEVDEPRDYSLR
jgi:hypothetical protein